MTFINQITKDLPTKNYTKFTKKIKTTFSRYIQFYKSTLKQLLVIYSPPIKQSPYKLNAQLKRYIISLFLTIASILNYIPSIVYQYLFTGFFTKPTYKLIGQLNQHQTNIKHMLDIGTGTGHTLMTIIHYFKNTHIMGVYYYQHYIPTCKKLFQIFANVEIRQMNFYDLDRNCPQVLFDIIIFGSSFMLMPDQTKAIQIAKRRLNHGGKIYFLLTLFEQITKFNKIIQYIKPLTKYLTTIELGRVTYTQDFEAFLMGNGFEITFKERCHGNFLLKVFTFFIYQVKKEAV